MSRKIVNMEHKVCDHTCMWNGIEDLYTRKLGEEVPDYFFFCLSGIGNFVYMKFSKGLRRMANWNDGRTKKMYQIASESVGFQYKFITGKSFDYVLKKAKEQIDEDNPVVLGALDMYYLEYYPKFYHKFHVPIHYILMVGYDEEEQCIYVYDCGRPDLVKLSVSNMEKALNIEKTELAGKNEICCIDFSDASKGIKQIAIEGFSAKAKAILNPSVSFVGIPGMHKLAKEILKWQSELTDEEYRESLKNITFFTGTVPMLPDKLSGFKTDDSIIHHGVRDKLGALLIELATKYHINGWEEAGKLFLESGVIIEGMTDIIAEYLLGNRNDLKELPGIINRIADLEEEAWLKIKNMDEKTAGKKEVKIC